MKSRDMKESQKILKVMMSQTNRIKKHQKMEVCLYNRTSILFYLRNIHCFNSFYTVNASLV